MKDNWIINEYDEDLVSIISGKYNVSETVSRILLSRGFTDNYELLQFLRPELYRMKSPFAIKDLSAAVAKLRKAVDSKKKIGLYSDSDLDGLTSLAVFIFFFSKVGIPYVEDYPKDGESYGLSISSIDRFSDENVSLILTLDCGVRDFSEIEYAKSKGIDVIVCDHHETGTEMPDCICVNPKRPDCTFGYKDLAGVGVAFKLVHGVFYSYLPVFNKKVFLIYRSDGKFHVQESLNGVILSFREISDDHMKSENFLPDDFIILINFSVNELSDEFKGMANIRRIDSLVFNTEIDFLLRKAVYEFSSIFSGKLQLYLENILNLITFSFSEKTYRFLTDVAPFAAIGTIADVVPLRGENRVITNIGLSEIRCSKIPSVAKIRDLCCKNFTSKNIAWTVGPLLNSPGRFGQTGLTASFLFSEGISEIAPVFDEIKSLNEKRKKLVNELITDVLSNITRYDRGDFVFVDEGLVHEGVCGIVAGKLCDRMNKPAIVLSRCREGIIKGSGRSPENMNLLSSAEKAAHVFERFGGHNQAFGFSIREENTESLLGILRNEVTALSAESVSYNVDIVIEVDKVEKSLLGELDVLEPFGNNNPEVIFCTTGITFDSFKFFGKTGEHLKLIKGGIEFILWGMALGGETFLDGEYDILYTVSRPFFRSNCEVRAEIIDFYRNHE